MDAMEPAYRAKKWSIAFACCLLNFMQTSGFFFTATTLMPLLVVDFGLDIGYSTVPIAVGKIAYVIMLIPGGMLVDFYGPRKGVLAGLAGLAIVLSLYSMLARSFYQVLFFHVCMSAVASVSGVPVYSLFIAQWFDEGIGLAMGLVLAGFSLAGTTIPAVLGLIGSEFGWRAAMGFVALGLWCIAFPIALFFLHENNGDVAEVVDGDNEVDAEVGVRLNESAPLLSTQAPAGGRVITSDAHTTAENSRSGLGSTFPSAPDLARPVTEHRPVDNKSWTFVGFAATYVLLQYSFGSFGENILFWLTIDGGYELGTASLFFSAMNMAAFSAKLIGGHLGDRFDRFRVGAALSGVASLGVVWLFVGGGVHGGIPRLTSSPICLAGFVLFFGFGYGGVFNALYVLVPLVFGRKNLGRIQSLLFGIGLIGNAAGSIITAQLRSRYGSYDRSFLIAGASCVTNFFVLNLTRTSLGGSMAGLKALSAETEPAIDPAVLAQLEADEVALQDRIGRPNDVEIRRRPYMRGPSSMNGSGFFEAVFAPSGSLEHFYGHGGSSPSGDDERGLDRSRSRSRLRRGPGSMLFSTETGSSLASTSSRESIGSSSGVNFESGFPFSHAWSAGSLQRYASVRRRRAEGRGRPGSPRNFGSALQGSSSVLENLVSSGIVSQSFEDVGYGGFGRSPTPSSVPTLGGFRESWPEQPSWSSHGFRRGQHGQEPAADRPSDAEPETTAEAQESSDRTRRSQYLRSEPQGPLSWPQRSHQSYLS